MQTIFHKNKSENGNIYYRSKWGFYPCDYVTYLKLKKLRGYFYMALARHKAWERWHKRLAKNKFVLEYLYDENGRKKGVKKLTQIPEPVLCSVFSINRMDKHYFDEKLGYVRGGINVESRVIGDWGVLEDYHKARLPADTATEVSALELSIEQIDNMLKGAEAWHVSS